MYLASPGHPTDISLQVGQGLLSLQQVRVEGDCFYFFCVFTIIHFHFSPVLSLSSPLLSLQSLFSLSLGADTKGPTRVDMPLNRNTSNMQTVQTQIRLLLLEQSDQGLHCLPFH